MKEKSLLEAMKRMCESKNNSQNHDHQHEHQLKECCKIFACVELMIELARTRMLLAQSIGATQEAIDEASELLKKARRLLEKICSI